MYLFKPLSIRACYTQVNVANRLRVWHKLVNWTKSLLSGSGSCGGLEEPFSSVKKDSMIQ